MLRAVAPALATCLLVSCAEHKSPDLSADRFVRRANSSSQVDPAAVPQAATTPPAAPTSGGSQPATPTVKASDNPTIESKDSALATALAALQRRKTPELHRRVAAEYRRMGVLDQAYDHFTAALKLDSRDAASLDGRARIWRDWGLPHLGLADANRATSLVPRSAEMQNTLGTLLFALGDLPEAEKRFEMALARDPGATYALNNLCYVAFERGDMERAIAACREALGPDPGLAAARHNLALAYAASDRLDLAQQEFETADAANSRYNMGIVWMARREYAQAAAAFGAVCRERPSFEVACARAARARVLAAQTPGVSR